MKYLAILFMVEPFGGDTFSLSREIETKSKGEPLKKAVLKLLCREAGCKKKDIDTVLVLVNGNQPFGQKLSAPEVVHHWTAGNGDI